MLEKTQPNHRRGLPETADFVKSSDSEHDVLLVQEASTYISYVLSLQHHHRQGESESSCTNTTVTPVTSIGIRVHKNE